MSPARLAHVGLRSVHIVTAAVVLGGVTLGVDPGPWWAAALATGLLLLADEVGRHGLGVLRYVAGISVLTKVGLLVVGWWVPEFAFGAVWTAAMTGAAVSHLPGAIRHRALWGVDGPCAPSVAAGAAIK